MALHAIRRSYDDLNGTFFRWRLSAPGFQLVDVASRLGRWVGESRLIELSRALLLEHGWGALVEVLKHEMAHQYVDEVLGAPDETSHGPAFRKVCEERGFDSRAAGFQVAGNRAIRIDMLERLSDLIRARVSWRRLEGGAPAPSGATGDGGFRAAPELMSVVGCSGDDFASILKALGFWRERRQVAEAAPAVEMAEAPTGSADADAMPGTAEPALEEIWRPGKRKDARKPHTDQARPKPQPRRERHAQAPRQHEKRPARIERKERPRAPDSSPFAVLAELRRSLAARRPEGN